MGSGWKPTRWWRIRGRLTIVKERLLGSVQSTHRAIQQLLRVDNEDARPLDGAIETAVLAQLERELERADGVLVSDINKGLLTPAVLRAIIEGAKRRGKPVIIDPRMAEDFAIYRGASALTPNRYETERASGIKLGDPEAWPVAARKLLEDLELDACLVTLDRDGMFLAASDGTALHIGTEPREVYDVTGAGDVVLAIFGLFLIAGVDPAVAARLANVAAGLEVGKQGAAVLSRAELTLALQRAHLGSRGKVLGLAELLPALENRRREGLRICFTNGCFDLLHAGHIESLEFARAQGDLLVVGLNSDSSVRQIKGEGRPVYPRLRSGPNPGRTGGGRLRGGFRRIRAPRISSGRSVPTFWSKARTGRARLWTAASSCKAMGAGWSWPGCSKGGPRVRRLISCAAAKPSNCRQSAARCPTRGLGRAGLRLTVVLDTCHFRPRFNQGTARKIAGIAKGRGKRSETR